MAFTLPAAPVEYERQQEQKFRSLVEERLGDIEGAIFALRTTYGTVGLGEGEIVLANGANSDIAPGYATYVRITGPTGSFSTSGFVDGERGRLLIVRNTTAQQWTITNEATSAAANQIITSTGADVVLTGTGGAVAVFVYDGTSERWILTATQG